MKGIYALPLQTYSCDFEMVMDAIGHKRNWTGSTREWNKKEVLSRYMYNKTRIDCNNTSHFSDQFCLKAQKDNNSRSTKIYWDPNTVDNWCPWPCRYTVKVLLFVGSNFRGFYKRQWILGSWIRGFKHYRQQSMGKL